MAEAVEVVQVVPQEPFPRLSEQSMDVDGVKPSEEDGHLYGSITINTKYSHMEESMQIVDIHRTQIK